MSKSKKAEVPAEEVEKEIVSNVESADGASHAPVQEEAIEEVPVEENQESSADDIAGGGPKNPPKIEGEEDDSVIEETTVINDGADGNAGQDALSEIEYEGEEVPAEEDPFISLHVKFKNGLIALEQIRDSRLSPEKDEDLEVAIVYAEQAAKAIEKLIK